MPARTIGIMIIALGLAVLFTPRYIFPVCGMGRYAPPPGQPAGRHACHGTLQAETVLGLLAIPAGIIPVLWPRRRALLGTSAAALVLALLIILFPTVITGMCKVPTMPCVLGTRPALIILGSLMALTGGVGITLSRKLP